MSPLSNGDILFRYMGENMSPLSNGDISVYGIWGNRYVAVT